MKYNGHSKIISSGQVETEGTMTLTRQGHHNDQRNTPIMMVGLALLLTTAEDQPSRQTDTGSTLTPQVKMATCFHEEASGTSESHLLQSSV